MNATRAIILLTLASLSFACQRPDRDPVEISGAHSRSTPPGATVGAAYMTVRSRNDDVLIGASTPVADRVEMHFTQQREGMVSMRELTGVTLSAGTAIEFAPGAAHFMLIDLHAPLTAGTSFPMTLRFEKAGNVTTSVRVMAPGDLQNQ